MQEPVDTIFNRYNEKVDPYMRRTTRGTVYEDKFAFQNIALKFIDTISFCKGASHRMMPDPEGDRVLFYCYEDEAPVMIDCDGVYKHDEYSTRESEEQAYFALSQLDAAGYVSMWRKI